MARLTIEINAELGRRLGVIVAEHNVKHETTLDLAAWILDHLRTIGINKDLAAASQNIANEADVKMRTDMQAALDTEKQRLLTLVT